MNMEWVKDKDEFTKFLEVNLRWSEQTAKKHADELREKYFPNISEMENTELIEQMADVSK